MSRSANGAAPRLVNRLFRFGSQAALTDHQLLDRCAGRRDEEAETAFAALVARHGPMVRGVGRRLLRDDHAADDVFQAVFLVLVRKAGSIRLAPDGSLGPWLHGVTYRIARRTGRLHSREVLTPEVVLPTCDDHEIGDLERGERLAALHEEMSRLPEKYRAPVVLCHLEGLTHEEAARRLGWPLGTVKGRLSRARSRLRDRLSRRGVTPSLTLIASWLAREARAMTLPLSLADATARTTFSFLTSGTLAATTAGTFPASAAALADGALKTMTLSTLGKYAALGILTLGLASGAFALVGPDGDRDAPQNNALPHSGQSDSVLIAARGNDAEAVSPAVSDDQSVLKLSVIDGAPLADERDEIWFRMAATNMGNQPIRDVTVALRIPEGAGITITKGRTRSTRKGSNHTLTWHRDVLEPGKPVDFSVKLQVLEPGSLILKAGIKARGIEPAYLQFITNVRPHKQVESLQERISALDRKIDQVGSLVSRPDNDPTVEILKRQRRLLANELERALDQPTDLFEDEFPKDSASRRPHTSVADETQPIPTPLETSPRSEPAVPRRESTAIDNSLRQARREQEAFLRAEVQQLRVDLGEIEQLLQSQERTRLILEARRELLEDRRARVLKEIESLHAELSRLGESEPPTGKTGDESAAPE